MNALEKGSINRNNDNIELVLNIKALGFIMKNSELHPKESHKIYLQINRTFPYPGGINFSWLSAIFHPNIHPVEKTSSSEQGTGYICLNILRKWSRLSDLVTTVKALRILVENPNPDDPLDYPSCSEAAKYFKKHKIEKLKKKYSSEIDLQDLDDDKDDDIVIVDD